MGKTTEIPWCHSTFNPWHGCSKVSPGCAHCYAEALSNRFGNDVWGPSAKRRFMSASYWGEPIKWNAQARARKARKRIFCASMSDVFEDRSDLSDERARLFRLIEATPNLDWLLLTKRPQNVAKLLPIEALPGNVWLGVSAENQKYWNERVPMLLSVRATVHFVSAEPLLAPLDILGHSGEHLPDWIIVGGESGPSFRPMAVEWARSIRDQSLDQDIVFFLKQLGGYPDKRHRLEQFPPDLRIQEFPET